MARTKSAGRASDPDGDALTFDLYHSADGGATWSADSAAGDRRSLRLGHDDCARIC